MVSTRGGARTAPEESASTLRKKPVRQVASKSRAALKATTGNDAKTRSNKSDSQAVVEDPNGALQTEPPADIPAPKPARAVATRAKKELVKKPEPARKPAATKSVAAKPGTRITRNTRAGGSDEKIASEEIPTLKPKAPSRATRATRATAAKEKAQPLSPKKITQVSRAPVRATRATITKTTAKRAVQMPAEAPVQSTRKRTASNENEEHHRVKVTGTAQDELETAPRRSKRTRISDEEIVLSSRTTTPVSSPQQAIDEDDIIAEEDEAQHDSETSDEDEHEEEGEGEGLEVSFDELCGPKTPMKRCSPRQTSNYTSRRGDPDMRTPVRRFAVYGSQHRTPHTQRPASIPAVPMSEPRPMTVARAGDRAMVFSRLEPLPDLVNEDDDSVIISDGRSHLSNEEPDCKTEGEPMIYEFDFSELNDSTQEVEDELLRRQGGNTPDHEKLENVDSEEDTEMVTEHAGAINAEDANSSLHSPITFQSKVEHALPVDTLNDEDVSMSLEVVTSSDTVPQYPRSMVAASAVEDDTTESMQEARSASTTPVPQTLVWDNVDQDMTTESVLEQTPKLPESLPQFDQTEILSISSPDVESIPSSSHTPEPDTFAAEAEQLSMTASLRSSGQNETCNARDSVDATLNFSDFIDADAVQSADTSSALRSVEDTATQDDLPIDADDKTVKQTPCGTVPQTMEHTHNQSPCAGTYSETSPLKETCAIDFGMDETLTTPSKSRQNQVSFGRPSMPSTPFQFTFRASTPHYAISTVASRRKSFSAIGHAVRADLAQRPKTSDGSPISISPDDYMAPEWLRKLTPRKTSSSSLKVGTGHKTTYQMATTLQTPTRAKPMGSCKTDGPQQRTARLASRKAYGELLATPARKPAKLSGLHIEQASAEAHEAGPASKGTREEPVISPLPKTPATSIPATPPSQHTELPIRKRKYEEYSKTAMPPARFCTPLADLSKRPATTRKLTSFRERVLIASTSKRSRTPTKTPLKGPAETPRLAPMTPHPAAPLRGVVALVEVYTNEGASASSNFIALLHRLGAKTVRTWSDRLTHVVFKEGSPTTLQRLRLYNKDVAETDAGTEIHCVNSRWVSDCDTRGNRMDESDDAYVVDVDDVPRAGKRRRKSMEPSALMNINGNVVRDRKTSLGKSSLSRLSMKMADLQDQIASTEISVADENVSEVGEWSPATPAYLAAPDSLVQQTAPLHRVRKLDLRDRIAQEKQRRLTFWNGEAQAP